MKGAKPLSRPYQYKLRANDLIAGINRNEHKIARTSKEGTLVIVTVI